jgi:protein gp37
MALKKAAGNMYSWVTNLWNPVKGECPYHCSYCYVSRTAKRYGVNQKLLHLDEKELRTNLGAGNFIFVCSGCDLFHPDVPLFWLHMIIPCTWRYPENDYLWHTKNPARIVGFSREWFPVNSVLCVTIESNIPLPGISHAPQPVERIEAMKKWRGRKMITVEPAIKFDATTFSEMILSCEPEQVNIGLDSGKNILPEPTANDILELIARLREGGIEKIDLKKNISRLIPNYKELSKV